jgi:hypothetical protein
MRTTFGRRVFAHERESSAAVAGEPPVGATGGFTTELHLAVGQGLKPGSMVVTAGRRGDSPQFVSVGCLSRSS